MFFITIRFYFLQTKRTANATKSQLVILIGFGVRLAPLFMPPLYASQP